MSSGAGGGRAPLLPLPADPQLVARVLSLLKSDGFFDQFRKECIADVDTKPAYQNLRQRVESTVAAFLNLQTWSSDLNKNQLREKLRKHIFDSNFLDQGVERIVDQVVNPKISSVFVPQVEEIVYKCLGLEKPDKSNGVHETEIKQETSTDNLLPNDLESVSPESVKSLKSNETKSADVSLEDKQVLEVEPKCMTADLDEKIKEETNVSVYSEESENSNEEEFESPAFEPLESNVKDEGNSKDSHLSGISDLTSHNSNNSSAFNEVKIEREDHPRVESLNSNSQLSKQSDNIDKKQEDIPIDFKNTFGAPERNEDNSNCEIEPMEVSPIHASQPYKFNDDNASDARQFYEENVDNKASNITEMYMNEGSVDDSFCKKAEVKSSSNSENVEILSKQHRESVESKTSTDSNKGVCSVEMSVDSNESNSVFDQSGVKSEPKDNQSYSFENKIQPMDKQNIDLDASKVDVKDADLESIEDIKNKDELKKVGKDNGSYKSSKESERRSSQSRSRDKKDDSKHSKSTHSRHSSSGRHDHERRHSTSHDKKDSHHSRKDSESRSKDKDGKPSNGDSKKDRHGSSSHRSSSSHKSSKHASDSKRHDERSSKHSSSDKYSKDYDKNRDSHRSSKSSSSKDSHSKNDGKSSSHHSKERSSSKSKEKGSSDKKSSDKKSDDKRKSKSNKDDHCSTSSKSSKFRRSTDRDSNDGNNSFVKGSSVMSSNSNTRSTQKKSTSNGDNGSAGNSSGQSDSTNTDSVNIIAGSYIKSEFNMFQFGNMNAIKRHSLTEKSPPVNGDINSAVNFPGQTDLTSTDTVNVIAGSYIKSEFNMFQFGNMNAIKRQSLIEKSPPAKFPEKSPLAKFSEKSPPARFPEKSPLAKFPSNSPILRSPQKPPSPKLNDVTDSSPVVNTKPVIHIDIHLKPVNDSDLIHTFNCGMKKPKCASNFQEAIQVMKIRKKIKKMERENWQKTMSIMEKEQNIPKFNSQVYSDLSGPELELTCMQSNVYTTPQPKTPNGEPALKYFDEKHKSKITAKINSLMKCILDLEKTFIDKAKNKSQIKVKNGFVNKLVKSKANKISHAQVRKIDLLDSEVKISPLQSKVSQHKVQKNDVKVKENKVNNFIDEPCDTDEIDTNYYKEIDMSLKHKSKEDIMQIILGSEENFDMSMIYIDNPLSIVNSVEQINQVAHGSPKKLRRKRSSVSTSSVNEDIVAEKVNYNNNLEDLNLPKKKRVTYKMPLENKVFTNVENIEKESPASPPNDKSIENHMDENAKLYLKSSIKAHNPTAVKEMNQPNHIARKMSQESMPLKKRGSVKNFENKLLQAKMPPRKVTIDDNDTQ